MRSADTRFSNLKAHISSDSRVCTGVSLFLCPRVPHLYRIEILLPTVHDMTAPVLKDIL